MSHRAEKRETAPNVNVKHAAQGEQYETEQRMPYRHLPDIQSEPDDRNVPLDRAGIKDLLWPITVQDRRHGKQTTVAKVSMFVNLPHNYRGTHMSRFVEVLNEYRGREWIDLTGDILNTLRENLDADEAHMEVEFPYFVEKASPVTGIVSLMSYICRFRASCRKELDVEMSVEVPVITVCPCSREISDYGAHNQRCMVTVHIRAREQVWIEEIIDLVEESASGSLYSILKRPDEKFLTEQAYDRPMFVEDVVREVAVKLDAVDRIIWYAVEADSQESIHNHNAYARVERNREMPDEDVTG